MPLKRNDPFFLLVEFSSDAEHVLTEVRTIIDLLEEQKDGTRRRLMGRMLVMHRSFLAEAIPDLYRLVDKVNFILMENAKQHGQPTILMDLPRMDRKSATEIARRLKPSRNIFAHPYRQKSETGSDEPVTLYKLLALEGAALDVKQLWLIVTNCLSAMRGSGLV
jgi:hypothetical protein